MLDAAAGGAGGGGMMDAVKFVEEAKRMCHANIDNCADCFKGVACPICLTGEYHTPTERVKIVEEWSATHPRKTRQSVFLEQYPETQIDGIGVLDVCPAPMDLSILRGAV